MAYTTIKKPSDYFNTVLYTGDGTSPRSITGVGFQPDFLWIKDRSTAYEHRLMDAVKGSNKVLHSSATTVESSEEYYTVSSFDSDGWTGRNGTGTNQTITGGNDNGDNFVAWNWLASNTTVSNTDGSITSTVSANTTSGFSVVSYTGTGANATVGHGLGVAPKFIIVKNRSSATSWGVQTSTGAGFEMNLNNNEAQTATSVYWNSTDPTSSVFSVGTNAATNNSGDNMIAYCFAEIKGFSKFGKIQGNGNADGPFCYLGFSPAFVLYKKINGLSDWYFVDNRRPGYNDNNKRLYANTTQAEETYNMMNLYSNGFKITGSTHPYINDGAGEYIYMAFAEQPLVGDNPATAR